MKERLVVQCIDAVAAGTLPKAPAMRSLEEIEHDFLLAKSEGEKIRRQITDLESASAIVDEKLVALGSEFSKVLKHHYPHIHKSRWI